MNRVKDVVFFESIEKAIEAGNQLVLDSALRSDTIITADQKFELVKLAIEKRSLPIFEYICYLKSATDISEEQTDKLIELIRKSSQNKNQEPLYIIDRLQNINEKLDNKIQHNEAMKIISDLNKKNFKTNPPVYLAGNKGLTQSGTHFKPNSNQPNTKEYKQNHYLEPNTDKPSNGQSNKSESITPPSYPAPPLPVKDTNQKQTPVKAGLFTKNPASGKPAKQVNQTRKSNLDGYGAKGSANFNSQQDSVLLRPLPATPNDKRLPINDRDVNIYEEINLSILKKPNEKDSSQVNSNKRVNFDPALKDLTGKILPVKDKAIIDNTKNANQATNNSDLSAKPASSAPIDENIAKNRKDMSELLDTLASKKPPVDSPKITVTANPISSDNFKETQAAISKLFQPIQPHNKVETPSSKGQGQSPSVVDITSNDKKQPMPVIPQSHIPIVPPMPAEFKTTPPPPPPMPDFLGGNQGDKKIPTNLSAEQKKVFHPNTPSEKAGPQSKLDLNPGALKSAITRLKPVEESFTKTIIYNTINNQQLNFTGNKQTSSANNTSQPPTFTEVTKARARLRKTGNGDNQITHF